MNGIAVLTDRMHAYVRTDLKHDLVAGIVVGLVALPLAIAFAVASGARPEQGLYTSIIAGGLMALFSGSRFQVSGPTGAFVVILLGVVTQFGIEGLLVAGFLAGVILLLLGVFRLGVIIKYIPYPVIVGFTAGIAAIIFSGQIKDFFGMQFAHRPNGFVEIVTEVVLAAHKGINSTSVIIGVMTLAVLILWKRITQKFPPAPIALAIGMLAGFIVPAITHEPALTIGSIPTGLPQFHVINLSWDNIRLLLPSAFTIAILGAIESLLSAVVADGMTGAKHNSNKELISQGIGNMVVPFFGGIPATGAIARTATNIKNGGRTSMAAFIHAITLLVIMLFFAPFARFIPMAALASILMVVAYNMSEIRHFVDLFKAPVADVAVLMATFLLTVFVDLTTAVAAGLVLAALLFIKEVSEINVIPIAEDAKLGSLESQRLHESVKDYPLISLYEISGPMFFGAATALQEQVGHKSGEILILRMKHVPVIDATALHTLEVLIDEVLSNNGKVFLATVRPQVAKVLEKHGFIAKIGGANHIVSNSTLAIERAKEILAHRNDMHAPAIA